MQTTDRQDTCGVWTRSKALCVLGHLDHELRQHVPQPASLHPLQAVASSLHHLGSQFFTPTTPSAVLHGVVNGFTAIIRALIANFPDNIFWDFDYLAAYFLQLNDASHITRTAQVITRLLQGYGQYSPLRFRYGHDFFYGYDWARWVRKEPHTRQHVRPFDDAFLHYLQRRQSDLLKLVAQDDHLYRQLPAGQYRNPFAFAREPTAEYSLHRLLARRGLIPLAAWLPQPPLQWQLPYTEIRAGYAQRARLHQVA